ncbi:MAG: response regulator [Candidatus Omnitrophica bacterium]|nr:response regulator [Candidatus Omnitrophota bacterium]
MGKKILLIDDEEDILTTLSIRLESQGYTVVMARDGIEGLESIKNDKPDLIILDIMMPNMGGYQMLQKLKEISNQHGVSRLKPPVIVLTAKGEGVRDLFEMEGIADYVIKPFESKDLLDRIKKVIP